MKKQQQQREQQKRNDYFKNTNGCIRLLSSSR